MTPNSTIANKGEDPGQRQSVRKVISFGALLVAIVCFAMDIKAQPIDVRGGNRTLNITTGSPGSEPVPVVNTATSVRYWRQAAISKITVRTTCPGQSFTLKVLATGVTRGVAAPEVTLVNGMLGTDFITNIPRTGGWTSTTPTLRYTASATFAQGNSAEQGNDVHTVTYTIQVQ
jgi:hypothetical protein